MLTRTEAERLAEAIHALRAEWPTASLLSFLGQRKNRPLVDIALELVYVALDPETKTPARIDQPGPWKSLSRPVSPAASYRAIEPDDCATCMQPKSATHLDHAYEPLHARSVGVGPTDEQRAAIRAALTKPDVTEDDMDDDRRRAEGEIA